MKNEYYMKINKAKTKVLVCSCNKGNQTQIMLDGDSLYQVNEYKNLRNKLMGDGRKTKKTKKQNKLS